MDPLIPAPPGVRVPPRDELLTRKEAKHLVMDVLKVSEWTYRQCYYPDLVAGFQPLDLVRSGNGTVRHGNYRIRAARVLDLIAERVAGLDGATDLA